MSGQLPEGGGQHNLAWEITEDRRFRPEYGVFNDLLTEIREGDYNVILSSEDFTGAFADSDRFSKFIDATRGVFSEVRIIVFLRNQVDYALSLYVELLKHGFDVPFDGYLDEISTKGVLRWREWCFPFDFLRFLSTFSELGDVGLKVCSYDLNKRDLMRTFLKACDVSGLDASSLSAPGENTKLSPGSYLSYFLRNRNSRPGHAAQDLAFDYIQEIWGKKSISLSARDHQFIAQTFKESNERVSSAYGVPVNEFMLPPDPGFHDSEPVAISRAFSVEVQDVFEQLSMKLGTELEAANACRKTLAADLEAAVRARDSLAAQLRSMVNERYSSAAPLEPSRTKYDSLAVPTNTISDTHTKVSWDVNSFLHPRGWKPAALLRKLRLLSWDR